MQVFVLWLAGVVVLAKSFPVELEQVDKSTDSANNTFCILCEDAVRLVRSVIDSNGTVQDAIKIAMPFCTRILKKYDSDILCHGILEAYGPVGLYVFSHAVIQPRDICKLLHLCDQSFNETRKNEKNNSFLQYFIPSNTEGVSPSSPSSFSPSPSHSSSVSRGASGRNQQGAAERAKSVIGENLLKIVQFNDVHLDPYYKEGAATECRLFICCRPWQPGNGTAGYYGDYHCDLPMETFDLMLKTVNSIDPDFIIFGGDNPPHDLWNETVEGQLASTKYIVSRSASLIPGKTIYPALGNHETFPQSEYLGSLPVYQEMTKRIAQYWQEWVEFPEEALDTVAVGGYYTMMIRKGLRLISVNSDLWYGLNFYSLLNDENPLYFQQINWLEQTFEKAKENGDKVLLLAHIPPGDSDNLPSYGKVFLNITKKYQKIIVGILSAHTHEDQFQLIQDANGIYGVTLVSPSVTPFGHNNPSFRVYYMDNSTYQLLDYEQYHLDLAKANDLKKQKGTEPSFELTYQATDEYSLVDLSPFSWAALVERFEEYNESIQQYYYNRYGRSKPFGACDAKCMREVLCSVKNCNSLNYHLCKLI